jgi:F0F1-type ATP synthase assembly protein I
MKLFTWRRAGIVIGVTVVSIAVFVGIGWGIDRLLDSSPVALIILFFISFPVAQFSMVKLLKNDFTDDAKNQE